MRVGALERRQSSVAQPLVAQLTAATEDLKQKEKTIQMRQTQE